MKKTYSAPTVNLYQMDSHNMICASVQSGGEGNGVPADARIESGIDTENNTEADWD